MCSTFVCPTELVAFSDNMDKFNAMKTAVVGVSTDSHYSHLAWINTPRKVGSWKILFCCFLENMGLGMKYYFHEQMILGNIYIHEQLL